MNRRRQKVIDILTEALFRRLLAESIGSDNSQEKTSANMERESAETQG